MRSGPVDRLGIRALGDELAQAVADLTGLPATAQVELRNFENGKYVVAYSPDGVSVRVRRVSGPNAVLSGIFTGNGRSPSRRHSCGPPIRKNSNVWLNFNRFCRRR